MNNTNKQLNLVAMALMVGLYSAGATAATDTGDASVVIAQPITITAVVDANFATIASGTAATAITVTAGNALSSPGGLNDAVVIDATGAASLKFDLAGVANQLYTLTIGSGVLKDNGGNGGADMAVNATVPGPPPALVSGGATVAFDTVLSVGADQIASTYSTVGGTAMTITANYN